eukprot:CAMPEP_0114695776 /NCGR_PEP_ID=MMETSP0191-20121206/71768_1 /TAXON_ID=126664 /ORGANISM="Sorites sp." /LENGTH=403 /DNA_ID=CAMNT_0001992501 /DNA_START=60 /DNA_END=1268 /DNA_ORIENTATION=+
MPGPAATLMIEDALQAMVRKDGMVGCKYEKSKGLIPMGTHSCFGDFPSDYLPEGVKSKLKAAQRARTALLPRISKSNSDPGLTLNSKIQGFSWNPHLPPDSPPHAGARKRQMVPSSPFRDFYDRRDLPISILHGSVAGKITWKVDLERLDYHHFLPIFFEGLREKEDPYRFLAVTGTYDMLARGGPKILPVVPQLIIPMKTAFNTKDPTIICTVLKVLQTLVLSGDMIGEALVPYYRQILPTFALYIGKNKNLGHLMDYAATQAFELDLYIGKNKNLGHLMDYAQRKRLNLGELIHETLEILEAHGGEDAFINIKYMIPTYESCAKARSPMCRLPFAAGVSLGAVARRAFEESVCKNCPNGSRPKFCPTPSASMKRAPCAAYVEVLAAEISFYRMQCGCDTIQ